MNYLDIALIAGIDAAKEVLFLYRNGFETQTKEDNSFVTSADIMAHKIINQYLAPTEIPVLSEEGNHFTFETRKQWKNFWCIDPIDGTLELVNKTLGCLLIASTVGAPSVWSNGWLCRYERSDVVGAN